MNEIQIFSSPQFGQVRTQVSASGEPLFCALDVCTALGYSNPRKTIADHVDEGDVTKRDAWVETGKKADGTPALRQTEMTFVNESGLYSLIFGSKLESAKAFKRWVTSEVLPSIRKQGGYMAAKADESAEEVMARALLIAQQTLQRRDERIKALENENQEQTQLLNLLLLLGGEHQRFGERLRHLCNELSDMNLQNNPNLHNLLFAHELP